MSALTEEARAWAESGRVGGMTQEYLRALCEENDRLRATLLSISRRPWDHEDIISMIACIATVQTIARAELEGVSS